MFVGFKRELNGTISINKTFLKGVEVNKSVKSNSRNVCRGFTHEVAASCPLQLKPEDLKRKGNESGLEKSITC